MTSVLEFLSLIKSYDTNISRATTVVILSILLRKLNENYHIIFGILLFIFWYPWLDLLIFMICLLLNISLIYILKTRIKSTLLLFMNLSILFIGNNLKKSLFPTLWNIRNTNGIQFMLLVPKISFICEIPKLSLKKILVYIFFIPCLLFGPVVKIKFLEKKSKIELYILMKKIFLALISYIFMTNLSYFSQECKHRILDNSKIFTKNIFSVLFYGLYSRFIYYCAWSFSSLCYYSNGYDVENVHILGIEFATSIAKVAVLWNFWIHIWLKENVFNIFKRYSIIGSTVITFLVSAIWHGGKIHDFVFLGGYAVAIPILRMNNKLFKHILFPVISTALCVFQSFFFISYLTLPFNLVSLKNAIHFYRKVYYIGHIYILASFILHLLKRMIINLLPTKLKEHRCVPSDSSVLVYVA